MADTIRLGLDEATDALRAGGDGSGRQSGDGGDRSPDRSLRRKREGLTVGRPVAFPRLSRSAPRRPHRRQGRAGHHPAGADALHVRRQGRPGAYWLRPRLATDLAKTARLFGVAIFTQRNAYTCGELGYFTGRLADEGLVSFAATNGPALLAGAGSTKPVYCTNPMSFAAPVEGGTPLVIDQSSSATAFVSVRKAAEEGREIPADWALDDAGRPTTDPTAAMQGALLAFGGNRGANIALMVEVLAAGLSGANWSLDAPSISEG